MDRRRGLLAVCMTIACGGQPTEGSGGAWQTATEGSSGSTGGGSNASGEAGGSSSGGGGTTSPGGDAGTTSMGGSTGGGGGSSTGPHLDCSPWSTNWIGAPCMDDGECTYDGGICLREDEGFPCGTCSQPCDMLCPDLDGEPGTFCVDGGDVGLDGTGYCLSKCDPGLLGGDGCRDGYGCAPLTRFQEPSVGASVCVPDPFVPPESDCGSMLDALGASWEPTSHPDEHPTGYPSLTCTIDEPVILYEPVPGVTLRYVDDTDPAGVLLGCAAALATAETAQIAADMGAVEIVHYGTYNCRPIAGTSTLSQHAFANAIDLYGFTLDNGTFYTVLNDWEHFVAMPVTPGGTWLRDLTDALWDMSIWNIILTPEYNSDHNNHVHVDLTPGDHYYYWQ